MGAERRKHTAKRGAHRAGRYGRRPVTSSGEITPDAPRLKGASFITAIIERCKGRGASAGKATAEMRLMGAPTGRTEDVSGILRSANALAVAVPSLGARASRLIGRWMARPLTCDCPYVHVDGIYPKRSRGGVFGNVAVMVAIGVDSGGCQGIIGAAEGLAKPSGCRRSSPDRWRPHGLMGARLLSVGARLRHAAGGGWGSRRYLDMSLLDEAHSCRRR